MKLLLTFFDCHSKPFRHYVAQTSKPSTLADLVKFSGADCERYKGAKKEGKVVWSRAVEGHRQDIRDEIPPPVESSTNATSANDNVSNRYPLPTPKFHCRVNQHTLPIVLLPDCKN